MATIIETKRLVVNTPDADDLENLYKLQSDPEVMKYIGQGVRTMAEAKTGLERAIQHQLKHKFSLGNVYETKSGDFIGRAGLIHVAYDDSQPDIEFGYALLKKFWNKGYATELSKALINWGFENLAVKKLVGIIRPENERSRHVLEKVGMHYVGIENYNGIDVARYEISKNNIDYTKIEMVPATIADCSVMQNLARFYVYDISEFLGHEAGWEMPVNGLYECFNLKMYWESPHTHPYLIKYAGELAGFVIIDKNGSDSGIDFNVAQFFILRKFKNKGVGRYVAQACFDKFSGIWEVMVMPGNEGAYRFWRRIIKAYTGNHFTEYACPAKNNANEHRNMFRFSSNRS